MANYKGFIKHLESEGSTNQIEYLNHTPLKAEYYGTMDDFSKATIAWRYLLSEYNLAVAENEYNNLSHNETSDINKSFLTKKEIIKLEIRRDENRKIYEDLISNESI